MSPMWSDTRGSTSGGRMPMALISFSITAAMRAESARGSSPDACADARILSSTSVRFRTNVTSYPRARRWRTRMSKARFARACPACATLYGVGPHT